MIKRYLLLFFLLISVASAANMTFAPSQSTVGTGQNMSVTIIANTSELIGYQFDFKFDPEFGRVISVEEGTLFSQYGDTYFGHGAIDNENGTVNDIYNVLLGDAVPVEASGHVATINMEVGNKTGYYIVTAEEIIYCSPDSVTPLPSVPGKMILVNTEPVSAEPIVDLTIDAGCFLQHKFAFYDPDGDPIYLLLDVVGVSPDPDNVHFNSTTQILQWTPTQEQVGTHLMGILVSDSWENYWVNFNITVNPAGPGGGVIDDRCDINKDGTVNIVDLVLVARNIGYEYVYEYDVNQDHSVDVIDLVLIVDRF